MKIGYGYTPENEAFVSKATGKEMRVKFKDCREICAAIKGMKALDAKAYLEGVLDGKGYIPVKKTKKQSGHKAGMKPYGKTPLKATRAVLSVLNSAIANAEAKGLDTSTCIVVSALAQRGPKIRRVRPKGRYAVYQSHLTTVQIHLEEVSE